MPLTDCPKRQPHDLEAEQSILGAILLDAAALAKAQTHMSASDFYDSRHRRIFDVMVDLAERGEGLDLLTIGNVLESQGSMAMIGGRSFLAELIPPSPPPPTLPTMRASCEIMPSDAG